MGAGHGIGEQGKREVEVGQEAWCGLCEEAAGLDPRGLGQMGQPDAPGPSVCHSDQRLAQLEAPLLWSQGHWELPWRAVGAGRGWLPSDGRPAALPAGRSACLPALVCSEK